MGVGRVLTGCVGFIACSYELRDGDIVNVDVSAFFKNHHADLNETYCVGNVDAAGRKLVRVTYECLWKAIKECKPGTHYRDVGTVISKHALANGLDVVRTYCNYSMPSVVLRAFCPPN